MYLLETIARAMNDQAKGFFSMSEEDKEILLSNMSVEFLQICLLNKLKGKDILNELDTIIQFHAHHENYESCEAYKIIKEHIQQELSDHGV